MRRILTVQPGGFDCRIFHPFHIASHDLFVAVPYTSIRFEKTAEDEYRFRILFTDGRVFRQDLVILDDPMDPLFSFPHGAAWTDEVLGLSRKVFVEVLKVFAKHRTVELFRYDIEP